MKKTLVIIFSFICLSAFSQPNWQWGKQIGGPGKDYAGAITDKFGNVYEIGLYHVKNYFNTDTVFSNGGRDVVVAKYDNAGNELWVKSFGASKDERIGSVILDSSQNHLIISGTFAINLNIDTFAIYSNGPSYDIFCVELNVTDGKCNWLKGFGSYLDDVGTAISLFPDGNIILSGFVADSTTFDTISFQGKGGFLAKLDSNGSCIWVKKKLNDIYITDILSYDSDFILYGFSENDTSNVDTIVFVSNNVWYDVIIARINFEGNVLWAKSNGGIGIDVSANLSKDMLGNIYSSGTFHGLADFNGITLTNGNNDDCFLAKYDSSGNMIWIKQSSANGIYGASGYGINTDSAGNSYFIGSFSGSGSFGSFNLTAQGAQDMFIARYDSGGNCIGVLNVGGINSNTIGNTVSVDMNGNVTCTGTFTNNINIGPQTFTEYGWGDGFVAKLDAITGTMENTPPNNQLLIYANPTQGKCSITIPGEFANDKQLTLTVYDNIGREIQVQTITMHEGKIKLNLAAEAKGMYHVSLSNGKKSFNGKIVFE